MENQEVNPIPTPQSTPGTPAPRKPYPGSIGAMIMGIIAVILCWYSFIPIVGFFFFIPSLILGIIAMKRGKKYAEELQKDPEAWARPSVGFLKAAKITGLVSVIAGPVMLLIGIIMLIIGGAENMF